MAENNESKQANRFSFLHSIPRSSFRTHSLAMDYIIVSLVTILFLTIGALLEPFIGVQNISFIPFVAVVFATWFGGMRMGITAVSLSTVFLTYVAYLRFQKAIPPDDIIAIVLFVLVGILISVVIHVSSKAAEIEELRKKEKQYLTYLIELQKAYKKAQLEVKARDEFLSIVSHELKTPLTSMLLKLQTVLHNIRNVSLANFSVENLLKMLESAEQQSKRLSKMITDLLNVSLITTGKIDLEPEKMDLSVTTKEVVERFKEKLEKEHYKLTVNAEHPVVGNWDRLRIEQAITNLLGNAIKYGKGNPIHIKVANSNNTGKFIIEDNGIGIPHALQEKIFTRFGRAVDGHAFEGLGVGLYITQQIVHAHKGELQVKSKEGYGSTFIIELPLG